ncbi:MAG TPA: Rad52/Rad22 family DNA repair protein, partial [Ignavibacteriaceae bacterium]
MTVNLEELKKEISYKLRQGPGGKQYAYIDARQVADLLDEVVGPSNWKDEFQLIGENLFCGLSIKIDNEWVTKWDVGTESNIEEEKGQASDAFKRSAVKWGVGR